MTASASPVRSQLFRADIEGLRAIAVLLIVGYHVRMPGLPGGFVGVDVFYVLSGYLITQILVRELEATGSVDLVGFYSRRARRLLPALGLVLAVTAAASVVVFAPFEQPTLAGAALTTAVYASNIYFARDRIDYLGGEADANPFLHTWSLSVEEQFYVVWPLFLLVAVRLVRARTPELLRKRLLFCVAAIAVLSFAGSVALTHWRQPVAFFLAPTRAWELALGAGAALIGWVTIHRAAAWLGAGAIAAAASVLNDRSSFPGAAALLPAVGTTLVILASAPGAGVFARVLAWRPFQEIGRLSYSWYLWHWPVLVLAGALFGTLPGYARLALAGLALVMAEVSYRTVEHPVRTSRWMAAGRWRSLVMAGAIAGLGVFSALVWRTTSNRWAAAPEQARFTEARRDMAVLYEQGCHAGILEERLTACEFGAANPTRTVVLLGDSHAAQWFGALHRIATSRGWRLVVMTKAACPAVDGPVVNRRLKRSYTECVNWRRAALDSLATLRPDLVIVSSFTDYAITGDEWRSGTSRILTMLSASARDVIILRDTRSPGFDVPACLGRGAWHGWLVPDCTFRSTDARWHTVYGIQQEVLAAFPGARSVDMDDVVCRRGECPIESPGFINYRDEHHLTNQFSDAMAEALGDRLSL